MKRNSSHLESLQRTVGWCETVFEKWWTRLWAARWSV